MLEKLIKMAIIVYELDVSDILLYFGDKCHHYERV